MNQKVCTGTQERQERTGREPIGRKEREPKRRGVNRSETKNSQEKEKGTTLYLGMMEGTIYRDGAIPWKELLKEQHSTRAQRAKARQSLGNSSIFIKQ